VGSDIAIFIPEMEYQRFKEQGLDMKVPIKIVNGNIEGLVVSKGMSIGGSKYKRRKVSKLGDIRSVEYHKFHSLKDMIL